MSGVIAAVAAPAGIWAAFRLALPSPKPPTTEVIFWSVVGLHIDNATPKRRDD